MLKKEPNMCKKYWKSAEKAILGAGPNGSIAAAIAVDAFFAQTHNHKENGDCPHLCHCSKCPMIMASDIDEETLNIYIH